MKAAPAFGSSLVSLVRHFVRYFAASAFGLAIDFLLALALNQIFGAPLMLAAVVSLLTAAAVMYVVHEFWTFRSDASRFSGRRLAGVVASAAAALAVRTGSLYVTGRLLGLGSEGAAAQLLFATGLSFAVNFLLVSRIIQGRRLASRVQRA